ncbi:DUF732 domain-containing protein [Mycobacterium sherrisii]|uniref:DUF732 domain-containing protein n=1 Tax=Mycobacterium sherrisii TaxID=243061 RepID=A0A1E3SYW4_9MYCO|nr:DUF732 domain-containing protein [Mycobacterium sherrisii]MCV7029488.1 DUF732 domain-containing protein [Mycobacterium sherrisii]MEC4761629.1 DUF732 domain-containing protein [Mycobacterium sherrisii]ODR07295.1 hypothetical protein BHQ21_09575 [Mycobacterium sherrisii]ORW77675.1 hypothetical protein AWC25_08275 [Mycobacterium sherrisii]
MHIARRTKPAATDHVQTHAGGAPPDPGAALHRSPRHKVTTEGFSGVVIAGAFLVIAVVGVLLVATRPTVILSPYGSAGAPPAIPSRGAMPKNADERLIAVMTTLHGSAPADGGAALVKAAHETCTRAAEGRTLTELANRLTREGMTFTESVVFVNTAVAIYCPAKPG